METCDHKSKPMGCILAIHKNYTDSVFDNEHSIQWQQILEEITAILSLNLLPSLNYTQYLVLSDLSMQSLFNDDFQLLFRIYWELWYELPTQIAFKHLSLFHIQRREDGETYRERKTSRCVLSLAV